MAKKITPEEIAKKKKSIGRKLRELDITLVLLRNRSISKDKNDSC